jgi:hypothetical protein
MLGVMTTHSPLQPRDTALQIRRINPEVRRQMHIECATDNIYMPELFERMWDTWRHVMYGEALPAGTRESIERRRSKAA